MSGPEDTFLTVIHPISGRTQTVRLANGQFADHRQLEQYVSHRPADGNNGPMNEHVEIVRPDMREPENEIVDLDSFGDSVALPPEE